MDEDSAGVSLFFSSETVLNISSATANTSRRSNRQRGSPTLIAKWHTSSRKESNPPQVARMASNRGRVTLATCRILMRGCCRAARVGGLRVMEGLRRC